MWANPLLRPAPPDRMRHVKVEAAGFEGRRGSLPQRQPLAERDKPHRGRNMVIYEGGEDTLARLCAKDTLRSPIQGIPAAGCGVRRRGQRAGGLGGGYPAVQAQLHSVYRPFGEPPRLLSAQAAPVGGSARAGCRGGGASAATRRRRRRGYKLLRGSRLSPAEAGAARAAKDSLPRGCRRYIPPPGAACKATGKTLGVPRSAGAGEAAAAGRRLPRHLPHAPRLGER